MATTPAPFSFSPQAQASYNAAVSAQSAAPKSATPSLPYGDFGVNQTSTGYTPVAQGGPTSTAPVVTSNSAQTDLTAKQAAYDNYVQLGQQQAQYLAAKNSSDQATASAAKQQSFDQWLATQKVNNETNSVNGKNAVLGLVNGSASGTNNPPQSTTPTPPTASGNGTQGGTTNNNPLSNGSDLTQNGITSATNDYLSTQQTIDNSRDEATQKILTLLGQAMNGTLPLTASQNNLIVSLQNQLGQNENQQVIANQAYTGAVTEAGFRAGGEYTPTQYAGQIANAVSYGVTKLQNLDNDAATTMATLENNFQTQNFDMINKNYDLLTKQLDDKSAAIKDMYNTVTSQLKDQRDQQQKVTDSINAVALSAAKNGATPQIQASISASKTESDAIAAAGDYLQTATGTLGDYLQYKNDALSKGLTPMDYQSYKDKDLADTEAIKAKAQVDAANSMTESDKTQQKLEQQYRTVLSKEFSSRTGSLGIENQKVNQANHLNSIFQQYYDPKTGDYNIPTSQYAEVAMGLANLISPSGAAAESDRQAILAKTAAGNLNGALQYITGSPQNGNTQAMIKNLLDSVDRQAETATRNREAALQNMRDQAPTDLDPSRIDALNKSTQMVSYEGQARLDKSTVNNYITSNPKEAENVAKLYEVPGATDSDIVSYLKAQGKIQ